MCKILVITTIENKVDFIIKSKYGYFKRLKTQEENVRRKNANSHKEEKVWNKKKSPNDKDQDKEN